MDILVTESKFADAEVFYRQPAGRWPEVAEKAGALNDMMRFESIGGAFALGKIYRGTDLAQPP